jgi:hypothetical protein
MAVVARGGGVLVCMAMGYVFSNCTKKRRGPRGPGDGSRFDVEQLVRDVQSEFKSYSAEKLEEM